MSVPFETTQKIVDAIEYVLSAVLMGRDANAIQSNFDLEGFVSSVQQLVPEAEPEIIVAYLQLYLTPMGEGEDDFYLGEDMGEGLQESAFQFDRSLYPDETEQIEIQDEDRIGDDQQQQQQQQQPQAQKPTGPKSKDDML